MTATVSCAGSGSNRSAVGALDSRGKRKLSFMSGTEEQQSQGAPASDLDPSEMALKRQLIAAGEWPLYCEMEINCKTAMDLN